MNINVDIPEYMKGKGLRYEWEPGFTIIVKSKNHETTISANCEGLVSLAKQLLTLAQDTVPAGYHFHYDEDNSLEDGSHSLIIEKIE